MSDTCVGPMMIERDVTMTLHTFKQKPSERTEEAIQAPCVLHHCDCATPNVCRGTLSAANLGRAVETLARHAIFTRSKSGF